MIKPKQKISVENNKNVRDLGISFIRLGSAMLDEETKIGKLAELAFDCGIQLEFKFEKKTKCDREEVSR